MHSFRLVETPCYTAEKNTIDMVPASDAMDILHGGGIDRLCIAASDGDYTMLAQRIREAGLTVLGEGKTPEALVASCREFRYAGQQQGVEPELQPNTLEHLIRRDMPLFEKAFETAATGKDEVPLSQTGTAHKKLMSKYRIKRYGCKTLGGSPSGSTGTSSSRRRKRVWREEKTLSFKISYTSEYRKAGLVRGLFFKIRSHFLDSDRRESAVNRNIIRPRSNIFIGLIFMPYGDFRIEKIPKFFIPLMIEIKQSF